MAESGGFKLKSMESIFAATAPNEKEKGEPISNLPVSKLIPFGNLPI